MLLLSEMHDISRALLMHPALPQGPVNAVLVSAALIHGSLKDLSRLPQLRLPAASVNIQFPIEELSHGNN